MNHYQHHIGDWLKKTVALNLTQEGAYRRLSDHYYTNEIPLSLDKADLYAETRCTSKADRDAVDYVLRKYFVETPDGYSHNRCDEVIAEYHGKSEKAKASADARWSKVQSDRNANALPTHSDGNASRKPLAVNHEPQSQTALPTPSAPVIPPTSTTLPTSVAEKPRRTPVVETAAGRTLETWAAYREAYATRYGVAPITNAKVNGMVSSFLKRVGVDEAPAIARHYLQSNNSYYVACKHAVDALLRDAEKLRTEWATGEHGTATQARIADRASATGNAFGKLRGERRHATG